MKVVRPLSPVSRGLSEEDRAVFAAKAGHIRKHVSILRFLADLGYRVNPDDPSDQQFSCDLHGGEDRKPSAKAYVETNSWYCWGCHKTRDHITTLRDKVPGLTFGQAYDRLVAQYGVPPFKGPGFTLGGRRQAQEEAEPDRAMESSERAAKECERSRVRLERTLEILTLGREVTLKQATSLWAAFDAVCWHIDSQGWSPEKGLAYLEKMRLKVKGLVECRHDGR